VGFLHQVTHVVSVSGGSILAAHLVLNWKRYNGSNEEFDAAAREIIDFVQLDVRNRIVRRLPLMTPFRMLQWLGSRSESRSCISTGALERLYDRHLYHNQSLHHLPESPELHILTTNVSEGKLCSFTQVGLILQGRASQASVLPACSASISMAVAASSAFPGFFPPVVISAEDLGLDEGAFRRSKFGLLSSTDTYLYIPLLIGLFLVLPAYLWDFYRQARINALVVHAIAHGEPDYRKILDLVKNESMPKSTPLPIESLPEASEVDYTGFELMSDTIVVDLRNQQAHKDSTGYYYRRIRLRRLADVTAFILQQDTPFDQVDFHNVSETTKLKVSKVVWNSKSGMTKWEVEFDLTRVPIDGVADLDFEAYFDTPISANKLRQTWIRYSPAAKTSKAAVWLLFPSDKPYEKYSLSRFKNDAPSVKTLVDTDFTVDHPFGDITGWTVLNPEIDYTYHL